jgi:glycosyltransferase involved in cell wall biosynthesis
MRVKLVTTCPPTNCGIAVYSQHIAEALKKLCDVTVLPIVLPKANPLYFVRLALDARKCDVAHVQYDCGFFGTVRAGKLSLSGMYTPLFYLLVKAFGGPAVVTTVHELQDAKENYGGRLIYLPMHWYYTTIYRAMVRWSDLVIVHTSATVETLAQYARADNTVTLPLAVHVRPSIQPTEASKAKLGLTGKRVIVMFGFVSPAKGHDLAVAIMRELPDDVVLYIAGDARTAEDTGYVHGLQEKVKSEGLERRVIFHGYVKDEDAPVVLSAADIVLMPYRHVVQSAALGNALAYLKPVLASDIGGFAEVAREYECIETFPAGDTEALKAKLLLMLAGRAPLDRLRENAARYVTAVSLENIAARTVSLYRQLDGPEK